MLGSSRCGPIGVRAIRRHKMTDFPLGLRPETPGSPLFRASQLLDEAPVLEDFAAKCGLGHAMGREECFNFGEDGVLHTGLHMRVDTRTSSGIAGNFLTLRGATRFRHIMGMAVSPTIDLAKLRALISEHTGKGGQWTRNSLSLAASGGRNRDLVRDLMKVTTKRPTLETAAGFCNALEVDIASVIRGVASASDGDNWLTVAAEVEAGVWQERPDWTDDRLYQVEVGPAIFEGERVGFVVKGRSMEKTLPPESILDCVRLIGSGLTPEHGDYVIVERKRGDLYERTCKRLSLRTDGNYELIAESYLPEFKEPIYIGKPDEGDLTDDETRVVALVMRAHLNLTRMKRRPLV